MTSYIELQQQIHAALKAGDVKLAVKIRAQLYRTYGERLHPDDKER